MDLRGRNFLKEADFTAEEWAYLLRRAGELKADKHAGREKPLLSGKNIALIFEKTSTRTRCSFEVATHDQGAHCTYLDPSGSQIGHKESIKDTARVLGRMFDAIEYRGFGQERVEALAQSSGVVVWNGLTDEWHPTQMLADQLTMIEHSTKPLNEIAIAYVGDARNNVGNSILVSGALSGMDVRMIAPKDLQNSDEVRQIANRIADDTGAKLSVSDDIAAVAGADFIYTDIWVSMGEPKEVWAKRIEELLPYQVNAKLLAATGNPEVKVLHCLPAYHDLGTTIGRQISAETGITGGLEITDEVFEAHANEIFDQAENRLHTIKAVMVETLRD